MRKNSLCLLTLLVSLCMPFSAFAIKYELCSASNTFSGELASPMHRNKSVDFMFKHNSNHSRGYKSRTESSSERWEMYSPSQNTIKEYGSAYREMSSTNYGRSSKGVRKSGYSGPTYSYSMGRFPQIKSLKSPRGIQNSSSPTFNLPDVASRMNVYVAGESEEDGNGNYWDEDEEDWLPIPSSGHSVGDKDFHDGKWWYWNGTDWIEIAEVTPIGDIPYMMILLLVVWKFTPLIKKLYLAIKSTLK